MRYRKLGNTGMTVSEVGYGAWGIGKFMWIGADDDESLASLKAAREAGVNFYDTALAYGEGHSERLLARAFGKSTEIIIASKVPPKNLQWAVEHHSPIRDSFPKRYVLDCLETTLKNLGREVVDVYQFHTWTDAWADNTEWQETVHEIRRSGKVKAVGISIRNHQPANVLKALETGLVDTVQVIYNLFDQSPEDELFPYCQKHGIGVIVRVPFDEGALTGKIRPDTTFPEGDFRNMYFKDDRKQQVWDRVQALARASEVSIDDLPELALRFTLSHPAVSTVIPGMRKPHHVAANVAASDRGALPEHQLKKVRPHRWVREFWD